MVQRTYTVLITYMYIVHVHVHDMVHRTYTVLITYMYLYMTWYRRLTPYNMVQRVVHL